MNILANYNWIKEYLKTELSAEDFARELSLKSMSVESLDYLSKKFDGMVVGVVKEVKDHPDADKLKIAITDIGSKEVEIVCGGKNLASGMRVLVALPGSKVRWHGEGDLVELAETKIRGVKSFGMICAPSEVGFEKAPCPEGGIWDLGDLTSAEAGTSFVDALDLNDVLFDIEVTSNRVDSMSIIGLAREGAATVGGEFIYEPRSLADVVAGSSRQQEGRETLPLQVTVEDEDLCPRYMAVVIDGVKVGPSPAWLQKKILLSGHRPINNIVDITNFILHEYGQPMHAFDYEKLADNKIVVRRAKDGEKFTALDESEYELTDNNLIIADGKGAVAVAGVMGGLDSGAWNETTTIVFEAATFDHVSVRRTSRALNLYSDSQLLFEKGLSTESTEAALARAVELTLEIAGGKVASEVFDQRASEYKPLVFNMHPQKIRDRIGVDIQDSEIVDILTSLGFVLEKDGENYKVTVPAWRDHDIEGEVDFSEEVARIYGYHNLPAVLPTGAPPASQHEEPLFWESWLKNILVASGYSEFYGYSFVSASDLEKYDLDPKDAVEIFNPLTSDLTHMRTSLMPSLLKDIEMNQGQTPKGQVFELSRIYKKRENDLPNEISNLTIAHFGVQDVEKAFLAIKGVLELIAVKTGLDFALERVEDNIRWHATRSAKIKINGGDVGMIGELALAYKDSYGIDKPVVVAELNIEKVIPMMKITRKYQPIPEYPAITRDLAIAVLENTAFFEIVQTIKEQSSIIEDISLVEIYRGMGVADDKKSLTLSIKLRSPEKTLSSEHADDVMSTVKKVLIEKFEAEIR